MAQKLIIDADPGIGDALAIALALFDPDLDVLAVTATAGCVSGRQATRNVQAIIEALDPTKWPRLGGCEAGAPAYEREPGAGGLSPAVLNGPSGLGDFEFDVADLHNIRDSAKVMIDIVRDQPNEVTLLTLGPLTNIELACERAPDFLNMVRALVCLGGSIAVGGDVTAAAEFNIYADPEAARNVLLSPATKTLVPLDVSSRAVLTFDHFSRLPAPETAPIGRLLHQMLPFALRAHHEHLGLEGVRLHEAVAVCAISQPRLFKSRMMALDIETRGELTRGTTVFDRRGIEQWQANIEVLHEVDAQGVLDYVNRTVARAT